MILLFTLTKTDNSWICVQDETFPLSNDAASELVNTFTSLQAVRDLGTAQDGENYGFSENAPTVTLTSSDSTNCSFVLGEANSMTGDYYLKREDSGEIYTVSSSLADSFHKTLTDLAEIESFPTISSDNVQELSITEEGTTLLFESSTTGSVKTWQISQSQDGGKTESTPEKATVNTVTTLVDHLGNLSFDSFVDHKEEKQRKIRTEESVHDDKLPIYRKRQIRMMLQRKPSQKQTLLPKQKAKQQTKPNLPKFSADLSMWENRLKTDLTMFSSMEAIIFI